MFTAVMVWFYEQKFRKVFSVFQNSLMVDKADIGQFCYEQQEKIWQLKKTPVFTIFFYSTLVLLFILERKVRRCYASISSCQQSLMEIYAA